MEKNPHDIREEIVRRAQRAISQEILNAASGRALSSRKNRFPTEGELSPHIGQALDEYRDRVVAPHLQAIHNGAIQYIENLPLRENNAKQNADTIFAIGKLMSLLLLHAEKMGINPRAVMSEVET